MGRARHGRACGHAEEGHEDPSRLLRDIGPGHPGLNSHKYHSLTGPRGEEVWESYVENNTPGAWRLWWVYGPGADTLTIVTVGPHP